MMERCARRPPHIFKAPLPLPPLPPLLSNTISPKKSRKRSSSNPTPPIAHQTDDTTPPSNFVVQNTSSPFLSQEVPLNLTTLSQEPEMIYQSALRYVGVTNQLLHPLPSPDNKSPDEKKADWIYQRALRKLNAQKKRDQIYAHLQ